MHLSNDRKAIEWSPNIIASTISIDDNLAEISLKSSTPNFKEYQMMELPSGKWQKVPEDINFPLSAEKHELVFRAVNLADVSGPEHKIIIAIKK